MSRWYGRKRGKGMKWSNNYWYDARGYGRRGHCKWYYWMNYWNQNQQNIPQNQVPPVNQEYWPRRGRWWNYASNWNYSAGPNYMEPKEIIQPFQKETVEDIKKKAREILKKAIVGTSYPGSTSLSIIYEGNVIGYLWSNVPLDKLDFGVVSNNGGKWYIPLIYENRIVGYLLI